MHRRAYFAAALSAALVVSSVHPAFAADAAAPAAARPAARAGARDLSATTTPEAVGFDAQRLKMMDDYMAKTVADGRVAGMTT
ncbi:MAG TPA: hypothetical protein VHX64_05775, partial [Caulobacteraceae bacterium]|nr:hypothetical protein [Caulobacteraceae bacterium]